MNVIHRDLKLENFLLSSTETSFALKLIDFGLSRFFKGMLLKYCPLVLKALLLHEHEGVAL